MNNEAIPHPEETEQSGMEVKEQLLHIPFPDTFTYINCAAFALSLMEFRIGFAEFSTVGKDKNVSPRVGVVMPPEAAAVLALALLKQLETYEKNFGEIRHPIWKAAKLQIPQINLEPQQSM